MTSYIENADRKLVQSLLEHLKLKVFTLENDQLSQVYQVLVLFPSNDVRFLKSLEIMTMRRLYSLTPI